MHILQLDAEIKRYSSSLNASSCVVVAFAANQRSVELFLGPNRKQAWKDNQFASFTPLKKEVATKQAFYQILENRPDYP